MDSFIKGIRADKNVILFRHPCGAIASSLNGIKGGKMQSSTSSQREQWSNEDKTRQYISKLGLTPTDIESMPEHEYLAIRWRLQNEDYLDFPTQDIENIYINYENFMLNQEANIKELFLKLALSYDNGAERFLQTSSGIKRTKPLLKDSSSSFYSVYKSEGFDPNKWQKSLTPEQISGIEKHTIDTFNKLIESSTSLTS